MKIISEADFSTLVALLNADAERPSIGAARRVLVNGEKRSAAAHAEGVNPTTLNGAIASIVVKNHWYQGIRKGRTAESSNTIDPKDFDFAAALAMASRSNNNKQAVKAARRVLVGGETRKKAAQAEGVNQHTLIGTLSNILLNYHIHVIAKKKQAGNA